MAKALEELEVLSELLQLEKDADLKQFKEKIRRLPLTERKANGYAWYPVQVVKSGYTYGERAVVTLERDVPEDEPHRFRAGKVVNFFTNQPAVKQREKTGVVNFVNKNRMQIILNSKDLPDWMGLGQIGVDLLFDERTYMEMEKALAKVQEAKKGKVAELRNVLLGVQPPRYAPVNEPLALPHLNDSQNEAINHILSAQDVAVVHGPPGTGKTTTLVEAVAQLVQQEATVLVTAPSNTAVDLLTERIAEKGVAVTRIGNISRVDESVIRQTLDLKLADHPESKNIKKVKIQAAEARRNARKYKRRFGPEERMERNRLYQEARELSAWARQLEDRLIDQILDGSQVITATLVGCAHELLARRKFRTVVIDEAAQALEPASWIPILKASRVVFAGDPFQLPPTVKSSKAQRGGLSVTLMEKLLQRLPQVHLLNVQYRMNEAIMGFSNQQFYDGALRAAEQVRAHRLEEREEPEVVFIDTAGCGFDEKVHERYRSRYNPEEFLILREHLYLLKAAYEEGEAPPIALISPYREQVVHMEQMIEEDPMLAGLPLIINTIDGFQGQERDVVYISLVRSNGKGEIGFLKDYRRMNVAMTRARKKLVVVGNSATVGQDSFYADFMAYCEEAGAYQTAWAYMRTA
jgi:ATP-dependent RNA/DNA helicase IGHMBP2